MSIYLNENVSGVSSSDHITKTSAKVMVNGDTIFTVIGDVQILSLVSECYTDNDATASTLQYSITTSRGSTQTLCNASTSLASKAAGTVVLLTGASTLAENPVFSNSGVSINTASRGVRSPSGSIKTVVGVGSTTGTWKHYIRWEPLEDGAYVTASF